MNKEEIKITDYIKGKVKYDAYGGQYFWDNENNMIAELRGWGRIQNLFKDEKGQIDEKKAADFQDEVGEWIVEAINEKLKSAQSLKGVGEKEICECEHPVPQITLSHACQYCYKILREYSQTKT